MSVRRRDTASAHVARDFLRRAFASYTGFLNVRLWDGSVIRVASGSLAAALTFRDPLAVSALAFEYGDVGVYQILTSKRGTAPCEMPLTAGISTEHEYFVPIREFG